ncbi:LPS export ABC transporter permease LptG [Salipiger sp. IMCC34102]|uniref:LPS export ABC transporter permease LptG n=1 Tax=Salipiger sp. IMCC34102 TaxID=2510647 RepID=UPI00101C41DF|nr:LPS export ABC transporter permease LptG [Salipiger sp. IMCC34102]RYH03212.1 LPS export ABC transporter permease LptG [Salipiger sp. IMCC34102]
MILDAYIARRFAQTLVYTFVVFALLISFVAIADTARRFSGDGASLAQIVRLALLSAPESLYEITPLITIIAVIFLFLGLARTSELVVVRAVGRSGLRLLIAPVIVAMLAGVIGVSVLNPIVAATGRQFEAVAATFDGPGSVLSLGTSGLWLRQGGVDGQTVIRAERANLSGTQLMGASFLTFSPEGPPSRRIEAASARLDPGQWVLTDAKIWPLQGAQNPEAQAETAASMTIPSTLTPDQIRNSFGTPSEVAIWDLPQFIERLQQAGFSAQRHRVWLQMELSSPAFLAAMVLIGAAFTMRPQRAGRVGLNVLLAIIVAFAIYFIRNFAQILGENGDIPVVLAAWVPPIAAVGLAMGLLLQREDG